ncbi:MAG: SMP-30/gluconolactonase/LRE family protein [Panacagrimonas sp.]
MKWILLMLPVAVVAYLLAWPLPIQPVAWTPPPAPSLDSGPFAANDELRGVQRIVDGSIRGPEAIAVDGRGRVYAGLADGRVISLKGDGSDCRVLGHTGGRPAGIQVQDDGTVLVADAQKGLLRLGYDGQVEVLATRADGVKVKFANDLDVDRGGHVYFTDSSWKFGADEAMSDVLEHAPHGRLLRYDPASRQAVTLLAGLYFANGVTLGPDLQYLLVSETTEYRVSRYWLMGEKAGTRETFIDNLPGFPDNIRFNGSDRFWLALYAPRDARLDWLLPLGFVRGVVARLPAFLQPGPRRQSFILGLDLSGKVVEQYQYAGDDAFGPSTSVIEHDGVLYLGSLSDSAIGRIDLDDLRRSGAGSAAPRPLAHSCSESTP